MNKIDQIKAEIERLLKDETRLDSEYIPAYQCALRDIRFFITHKMKEDKPSKDLEQEAEDAAAQFVFESGTPFPNSEGSAYRCGFYAGAEWQKEEMIDDYNKIKKVLALGFMQLLDNNRPEGKMCLSNGECADIDKAFSLQDWGKIARYMQKYSQLKED